MSVPLGTNKVNIFYACDPGQMIDKFSIIETIKTGDYKAPVPRYAGIRVISMKAFGDK